MLHKPLIFRSSAPDLSRQTPLTNGDVDRLRSGLPNGPSRVPGIAETPSDSSNSGLSSLPMPETILGNYRILREIGRGSSGVVFLGKHLRLPLQVALKILRHADETVQQTHLAKLRSEAVLLLQLNHPNIVRLWDYQDEGVWPYLATEYVDGRTLGRLLREAGPLPQDFALFLMRQAVAGLAAAAEQGITHRDLKPENLLVTKTGALKIADLGLAVQAGRDFSERTAESGLTLGTAGYIAPEQARDSSKVDFRADIYSLGATFYHLISGELPFSGRSPWEVILKHIREPLPPLSARVHYISPRISDLFDRMMAKDPSDRPTTYDEILQAIDAALEL